jgi:hypothetical protein
MRFILKKFSLLKRCFTTNNKTLALVQGESVKDLTNKDTNKKDNIKSNEYDIKNNDGKYHKLKIYNAESNTLHPWEEDV